MLFGFIDIFPLRQYFIKRTEIIDVCENALTLAETDEVLIIECYMRSNEVNIHLNRELAAKTTRESC